MKLNSILELLQNMPLETLRQLDKYMQSPYAVTHEDTVRLYQYLRGRLHDAPPPAETVCGELFPGQRPERMYDLGHYLREALETFLALEEMRRDEHTMHHATTTALRRMKRSADAQSMLRYAYKRLEKTGERGGEYYRHHHRLHLEAHLLALQEGRAQAVRLQELSDNQDVAFIVEKLRTGCIMLSERTVLETAYTSGLLGPVLEFLENHPFLGIPIVAAYYHGYYAQKGGENSETHFQKLKQHIGDYGNQFAPNELQDLTLMALNYAIGRLNRGEDRYFREVFELYQAGLTHGALLENGQLSRWTYNNITATALRLREYTWLEPFLNDYRTLLPPNHRDGAYHFNMARYCYDLGRLRDALGHLLHREYDNVLQNLQARVLLCKIYYELDEWDALDNQIDSLLIYLRRQKGLGYHRTIYSAIARFLRKLLNATDRDRLRAEIEAAPELPEREWLLRQV